jgi:hypothetical protein
LQDGIGYRRTDLTQCQEQSLRSRHIECLPILREQPVFKDTGLFFADCLSQGIGDGAP